MFIMRERLETHLEKLFAALWISEGWYVGWCECKHPIAWKARAMVLYDRVMAGES